MKEKHRAIEEISETVDEIKFRTEKVRDFHCGSYREMARGILDHIKVLMKQLEEFKKRER